jgi:hypothetical protein
LRPNRRLGAAAQARDRRRAARPKEKGRALRKPSLVRADLCAQGPGGTCPPLPARRPNCLTPPVCNRRAGPKAFSVGKCVQSIFCACSDRKTGIHFCGTRAEKTGALECADPIRPAPIRNHIVNLTLTTQSRRERGENASAAWTLQSLSCTTTKGRACAKAGQICPAEPGTGGKAKA